MNRRLARAVNNFEQVKKDKETYIPGILGFMLNGIQTVEVPGRPSYVFVRLRNNLNELIQAFNDKVSPVYDLPVLVGRDEIDKTRYKIQSRDTSRYENWQSYSAYLPAHGNQHSFNPDTGSGGDITWVYGRQFVPLSLTPSGTYGAANVLVQPSTYYQIDQWHHAGGTGTASFFAYKPTGTYARLVLVYLDDAGNPQLEPGATFFSSTITGTSAIMPYLPPLPSPYDIPLGAVRLVSGTSVIGWDNIYDLRPHIVGDGFLPTGTWREIYDYGFGYVSGGYAYFETDGTFRLTGTATAIEDLRVEGLATKVGVAAPTDEVGFRGDSNFLSRNFVHNQADEVQFSVQMPHDWNLGSPIYPHVHFSPWITGSAANAAQFILEFYSASVNDLFSTGTYSYTMTKTWVGSGQWYHYIAYNAVPLSMAGLGMSSMLKCRLYRDNSVGDNLQGKVAFLYFDIHYERDALGSSQEYVK